jgi:hypothetical protein
MTDEVTPSSLSTFLDAWEQMSVHARLSMRDSILPWCTDGSLDGGADVGVAMLVLHYFPAEEWPSLFERCDASSGRADASPSSTSPASRTTVHNRQLGSIGQRGGSS